MSDPADQREFLLRSLEDLEREHDAGDLDDADYLGAARTTTPPGPRRALRAERRRVRRPAGAATAGCSCSPACWPSRRWPACSWPRRPAAATPATPPPGASTSRSPRSSTRRGRCFSEGDADCAIELYDEVLAEQPTNAEALTYKGWAQYTLLGDTEAALVTLIEAATAHPDYPDVHAFLAVLFFRSGLLQQASNELDRLDALDPPPDLLAQIEGLRAAGRCRARRGDHVHHRRLRSREGPRGGRGPRRPDPDRPAVMVAGYPPEGHETGWPGEPYTRGRTGHPAAPGHPTTPGDQHHVT